MSGERTESRVYLDWAAATPLSPAAKAAMMPYLEAEFGNPSAIHAEGAAARAAVEAARADIARAMSVRPEFLTFTSGGTEANNIALFGAVEAMRQDAEHMHEIEVITTRIEHPSVYRAMHRLEQMGVQVQYVDVKEDGRIDIAHLKVLLGPKTRLVSTAYINSEVGTIQQLHAIRKALRASEEEHGQDILLHVDAAQAPLWTSCQFDTLGADLLTLDFGKCCGPKGVGALVRSRRAQIAATVFGGGQENGLRPGTENVASIVAAGVAFVEAQEGWKERAASVVEVRDRAIERLTRVSNVVLNGARGDERVANNINLSIPDLDTEYLAVALDAKGFAVSIKSACSGAGGGESAVVRELTDDPARASSTLRITLGPDTTFSELERLAEAIEKHMEMMNGVA